MGTGFAGSFVSTVRSDFLLLVVFFFGFFSTTLAVIGVTR
jgi:hypothetical protein